MVHDPLKPSVDKDFLCLVTFYDFKEVWNIRINGMISVFIHSGVETLMRLGFSKWWVSFSWSGNFLSRKSPILSVLKTGTMWPPLHWSGTEVDPGLWSGTSPKRRDVSTDTTGLGSRVPVIEGTGLGPRSKPEPGVKSQERVSVTTGRSV